MILPLRSLGLLAAILVIPFCEAHDIPADTPVSSLIASAKSHLAKGATNDALTYFDAAIAKDPSNYLTIFQRGATYLSLGRNAQASSDFDSVLKIRPDFEGALIQRARLKSRNADWSAAKADYTRAGKAEGQEIADLVEAEGAYILAVRAEEERDWEACINQAGTAIMVASTALSLRQLRARCRFERAEIQEGVSDLQHVLQISPGLSEPHMQIASMLYYSLGDTDRGVAQLKKCLHSDPESKPCKKLFRQMKSTSKLLAKVNSLMESRQYNAATKILVGRPGTGEDAEPGLLANIKGDVEVLKESRTIHPIASNQLYATLVEITCEAYREMNSARLATPYCTEILTLMPESLHGLLHLAQTQLDAENYDAAIATLNKAHEAHPGANNVNQKLNEAHTLLKRSKIKDYYRVLGVSRDADERTIKRAYRSMVKTHHPDKAIGRGMTKEEAEKKMAAVNEAYEVLSDPELKARFDRGEDPNDPMAQQGGNPFQGSPFGGGGGQQFFFQQGGGGGGGQRAFKFQTGGNPFGGGGGGGGFPGGFPFGG